MAMRELVEAECGGSNPAMRLASHFTKDSRGNLGGQKRLSAARASDHVFVQEFLSETRGSLQRPPPQTFRMDSLLREMRDLHPSAAAPRLAPNVADMAARGDLGVLKGDVWAADFLLESSSSKARESGDNWGSDFLKDHQHAGPDNPLVAKPMVTARYDDRWAEEYLTEEVPVLKQDSGGGELAGIANQILDETKGKDTFSKSSFFKFLGEVGSGDSKLIDGNFVKKETDWGEQFHAEASSNQVHTAGAGTTWAEEFADLTDADYANLAAATGGGDSDATAAASYKQDFWQNLEDEWKGMAASNKEHPWLSEFDSEWQQPFQNYEFREENPLKDHPNALEEGKVRLAQGDIPSAVLLFEAAVQHNPDSMEAWSLLGTTQAKNEQDPSAIAALKRALALNPGDSVAAILMALAVSYTNESYQGQACRSLQEWMQKSPQYSHLHRGGGAAGSLRDSTSSFMSPELHAETIEMFLAAARSSNELDADVQCGLGILFNLSAEYDKAVDCFRAALQARPEDALLWNKLGATLANGNRSEEAVSAYHTALQISPGFIRCRYNLGISCINMKAYTSAAQHFLTALNFQSAGRGPQGETSKSVMSESIWSSLRLATSLMDRKDLHADLDSRNLEKLSREFGVNQA